MATQVLPSLRSVLFGAVLLLPAACRDRARSDGVDNTTPPQDTTSSQSAPAQAPPAGPSSLEPQGQEQEQEQEQERLERIRVTGKDVDPSLFERERQKQERRERIHVIGKDHMSDGDEELQLGSAGTGGSGGSGGHGGSH